jgi:hypothetical protein
MTAGAPPPHQGYTVVGGFAHSQELKVNGKIQSGAALTLLSARPEGPRYSVLSLLLVANPLVSLPAYASMCHRKTHGCSTVAAPTLKVWFHGGPVLSCAWLMPTGGYPGDPKPTAMLRLGCGQDNWVAIEAIRSGRLSATLSMVVAKDPTATSGKHGPNNALEATIPFTLEALAGLPPPVSVSACTDAAYFEGNPNPADFPQWALAMQLMGFERLYVPRQLYYTSQYERTARAEPSLVMFGFDILSRYVAGEQFNASQPTTFYEVVTNVNINLGACLHEHWYDDWVFLSMSTDEYFSFVHQEGRGMLPTHPTSPMPYVQEYLRRYIRTLTKPGRLGWMPKDPLNRRWRCAQAACFPVRWYSAKPDPNNTKRVVYRYEDPQLDASKRVHKRVSMIDFNESNIGASRLSFEVRTYRTRSQGITHSHGAARKCAYHPDWRTTGPPTKMHGFVPDGCPDAGWLIRSKTCVRGQRIELRPLCWELCGFWGASNRTNRQDPNSDRIDPKPTKFRVNNSCISTHSDRYETERYAPMYRGSSRLYPACASGNPANCTGPLLERAHMRGDNADAVEAPWLTGLAPAVKSGLSTVFQAPQATLGVRRGRIHDVGY